MMLLVSRFSRELILAIVLCMGFAAMRAWAGNALLTTKEKIGGVPTIVKVEKTYFDRFRESVEDDIRSKLAKSMGARNADFSVQMDSLRVTPVLPELPTYQIQVLGLGAQGALRLDGLISLTVLIGVGRSPLEVNISGIIKVMGPVTVAKENLARGRLIDASLIETKILPWKILPTGAAGFAPASTLGRHVKSFIGAGSPVWSGVLEEQLAIRPGETVDITLFSGPGVIIRSKGVARVEGRVGEQIRVEQSETRKSLSATVTGKKSVEVRL